MRVFVQFTTHFWVKLPTDLDLILHKLTFLQFNVVLVVAGAPHLTAYVPSVLVVQLLARCADFGRDSCDCSLADALVAEDVPALAAVMPAPHEREVVLTAEAALYF